MLAVFNVVEKPAEVAPGVVTARLTHRLSFAQNATRSQPRQCSGAGTPAQLPAPRCSVSFHRGPQERLHGTSLPRQKCTGLKVHFVRCSLKFAPAECIEDHYCRALEGERSGQHWRARCPVCGKPNFELSASGDRVLWNCHTEPACDHGEIRFLLDVLVPCRAQARKGSRPDSVLVREVGKLLTAGMDPSEMRLRIGQAIWPDMSAADVAAELGLSRATRYRLRCPPRRVSP